MTSVYSIQYLEWPHRRSLAFRGDHLYDWVSGGDHFRLGSGGGPTRAGVCYAYPFDAVIDRAPYTVLYERRGTKGLLLRDGQILRELSRSFYHARDYDFPVALHRTPAGRTLLLHCPDEYNRLEIEDCEDGRRLSAAEDRAPSDYFYSQLAVSPSGGCLASAGWVWHPFCAVVLHPLSAALERPTLLDRPEWLPGSEDFGAEQVHAAFLDDHHLVVAATGGAAEEVEPAEAPRLPPQGIAVIDLRAGRVMASFETSHLPGPLMPVGRRHVWSLGGHPRLYHLATGACVAELPELPIAAATTCIDRGQEETPLALDPENGRFAVATSTGVAVVKTPLPVTFDLQGDAPTVLPT